MKKIIKLLLIGIMAFSYYQYLIFPVKASSNIPTINLNIERETGSKNFQLKVVLSNNSGIAGMLLTIEYDHNVMSLTDAIKGDTLSSLDYTTSNPDTELGYNIEDFRFMWDGIENDYSNGTLLTLSFQLNENIDRGDYEITFNYSPTDAFKYNTSNLPVYIDLDINPVSVSIDSGNTLIIIISTAASIITIICLGIWLFLMNKNKIKN